MSDGSPAIALRGIGKMYKLFRRQSDKMLDALGLGRLLPWRRKAHREFWALRDLDLEIRRGERVGIIGPNGAGKSTMLKIIGGIIQPTEGTAEVHGTVQALMELGTGFHPEFTGRENIRASLSYQGMNRARIAELEDEIIEFTELEEFIDQPIKTYSAGMYARLAFTVATSIEPDILIIDEVLGAGDAYFAGKCVERMRRLTEESGATVLFVSHDLSSVEMLCERAVWIGRGRKVADGATLQICQQYWASVLEKEKVRLNARNARLARKHVSDMQAGHESPDVVEVLLRFVPIDAAAPRKAHPVARVVLSNGQGLVRELLPGAPMDNDPTHDGYLIDDPKYMNWGPSDTFNGRRMRRFENVGGKYGHAPVVFAIPADAAGRWQLTVDHARDDGERVAVEQFDGTAYRRLGELSGGRGWRSDTFAACEPAPADVPPENAPPAETPAEPASATEAVAAAANAVQAAAGKDTPADATTTHDAPPEPTDDTATPAPANAPGGADTRVDYSLHQRDETVSLLELATVDAQGQKNPILPGGEPLRLRLTLHVREPIASLCVNLAVFRLADAVKAFDMVFPMDVELTPGRHEATIVAEDHRLRHGQYTIGLIIGRTFSLRRDNERDSYVIWNRGLSFQVSEPNHGVPMPGMLRVPARLAFDDDVDAYHSIDVMCCPAEGARSPRDSATEGGA